MLVDFFWQRSDHPILNSVIAAGIYSKLSNWYRVHLKYDEHEKVLPALKVKFQARAQEVCFLYILEQYTLHQSFKTYFCLL